MKTKLFILFTFIFTISLSAQNPREILDKASDAYHKAGGVTANFVLDAKDTKSKTTYSYNGNVSMMGNKFKIEMPESIIWFDGATQWVYVKDTEEVNVSNPTGEELQAISPSVLFSIYKKGFKLKSNGNKTVNGKTVSEIELTPEKKNSDFSKIIVQIDRANNIFHKITLTDKVGLENSLTISNYQTGKNLSENTFKFDKKIYPHAEMIDLR